MKLPVIDGEFLITEVLETAWRIRFPTADLKREHPLMCLWIAKNPSRTPTARGVIRFIESWLKRTSKQAAAALAGDDKRSRDTAVRVGTMHNVTPYPGESSEHYNSRVIARLVSKTLKLVA